MTNPDSHKDGITKSAFLRRSACFSPTKRADTLIRDAYKISITIAEFFSVAEYNRNIRRS